MGGAVILLFLLAFGMGKGGAGSGNGTGGVKGNGGGTTPGKGGNGATPAKVGPVMVGPVEVARVPGNPPSTGGKCNSSGCCYDPAAWTPTEMAKQLASLGYPTAGLDWGKDGILGTNDAPPHDGMLSFQVEYNLVSNSGALGPKTFAGGLDMDGKAGACTLNGLAHVMSTFGPGLTWRQTAQALIS